MKELIIIVSILFSVSITEAQDSIHYYIVNENSADDRELKALVDDKVSTLISTRKDYQCFRIEKKADFNKDGYIDILVVIVNGCGGTCCANSYQIFCYDGQIFHKTEQVGYDWDGIEITETSIEYNFIVQTVLEGFGNTKMCDDKIETYRLNGYQLELVSVIHDKKLNSITELKAADFEGREEETLYLIYDLDGDEKSDIITCSYWARWGRIGKWKIEFGNGLEFSGDSDSSPKRIGVMDTKTNNVNDLVLECDEILKWNGFKYE